MNGKKGQCVCVSYVDKEMEGSRDVTSGIVALTLLDTTVRGYGMDLMGSCRPSMQGAERYDHILESSSPTSSA
jgi:hypoxanthine-guanine phosphoribosyltransferase